MKVLILDAYNLIHRARSGFTKGEHAITYNFFRGLRPLIEKFQPETAYLVLEGTPVRRLTEHVEYKGNRKEMPAEEHNAFQRQLMEIVKLVDFSFPIRVVKHPRYEADDIIHHLVLKHAYRNHEVTVVSTDTDFIQMLSLENVNLWNPVKKSWVEPVDYDYVLWKALRGDASDNIPGIPGVGDKTAEKYVRDYALLKEKVLSVPEKNEIFVRNQDLIRFHFLGDNDEHSLYIGKSGSDWEKVKETFQGFEFNSMTKDKAWKKYVDTFKCLE